MILRRGRRIHDAVPSRFSIPNIFWSISIVLGHRVPGCLRALGDDAHISFIRMELHVLSDLALLLVELARWGDPPQAVLYGLPPRVHLQNEHLQFLPGVDVGGLEVFGSVRPGGQVAAPKEVVIEVRDATGTGLSGTPGHRLEVGDWILFCQRQRLGRWAAPALTDGERSIPSGQSFPLPERLGSAGRQGKWCESPRRSWYPRASKYRLSPRRYSSSSLTQSTSVLRPMSSSTDFTIMYPE